MNLFDAYECNASVCRAWVTVVAGAAALALVMMFLTGGYAALLRRRTGRSVPEGRPGKRYDAPLVRQFMVDAGESGWHVYRMQLRWDIVFAVLFGFAGVVFMDGIWGLQVGPESQARFLAFVPALAGIADVCEDIFLLHAVGPTPASRPYPDLPHPGSIAIARTFTWTKFALHATWGALVLYAVQRLVVQGPAVHAPI